MDCWKGSWFIFSCPAEHLSGSQGRSTKIIGLSPSWRNKMPFTGRSGSDRKIKGPWSHEAFLLQFGLVLWGQVYRFICQKCSPNGGWKLDPKLFLLLKGILKNLKLRKLFVFCAWHSFGSFSSCVCSLNNFSAMEKESFARFLDASWQVPVLGACKTGNLFGSVRNGGNISRSSKWSMTWMNVCMNYMTTQRHTDMWVYHIHIYIYIYSY